MERCLECRVGLVLYETWTAQARNAAIPFCRACNHRRKARAYHAQRYQAVTKPKRHAMGLSKPKPEVDDPLDTMPLSPRVRAMMTPEIVEAISRPAEVTVVPLTRC